MLVIVPLGNLKVMTENMKVVTKMTENTEVSLKVVTKMTENTDLMNGAGKTG